MLSALKKLIVGRKWKARLASRSRSQIEANARSKEKLRKRRFLGQGRPHGKHFTRQARVDGPEIFSLILNPEGMVEFLREVRRVAKRRNVFVNLSDVKKITPEAIAALLALIHQSRIFGTVISGNAPTDSVALKVLNHSGFRTYVRNSPNFQYPVQMGKIKKRTSSGETVQDRFDQYLAKELIQFAIDKMAETGYRPGPSYGVLCEAMLNTWNHAAKSPHSRERWWASVYFDADRQRACFTFIDLGVGIFNSHSLTMMLNILVALRYVDRGELLKRMLHGEIPSTTKVPGRGNGLPGMYDHCRAGRIRNLVVISNNTVGYAESNIYKVISTEFEGTLLYWEVGP